MLAWFANNIAAVLICLALVSTVILIIRKLAKDRKAGKSFCGCNCTHCALVGKCHGSASSTKARNK